MTLRVERLAAGYGGSQVLFDVSLAVGAGEVLALLGRNGMGKTTTVGAIMGLVPPWGGVVAYCGQPISGLAPYRVAQRGLGLVPEGRLIFPALSVEENLVATASRRGANAPRWTLDRVWSLFPRLRERRRSPGTRLSDGEQQMLAIGRALMGKPRLLLLDEPSMGLAPLIVKQIFDIIKEINTEGVTVLLVEQNAAQALALANRGYVLETGEIVLSGTGRELLADDRVRAAYLGEEIAS